MSGSGFPKRYSLCPYIWMFTCDESSYEFQALSLIADSLLHPQRSILSDFIRNSADREVAAYFFLSEIGQNSTTIEDFLSEWITLLRKVQPVECKDMDPSLRQNIWLRDGGKCCISFTENDERDKDPLVVHILSPTTFQDEDMIRNGRLDNLFAAFIGRSQVEYLKSLLNQDFKTLAHDTSEQLMLLSTKMFEHWANGRVSLKPSKRSASNTVSLPSD
ncbi:kinase-like domain [Pyrenophora seminiperda CCB06]|uniref:Kinase-like domain n=1 Tax=Pyrenophora seminiperda CCB06 TaxID=1302712 RepID=A0A3M7M493_9PLEO|nr:kinase-like domain [Pyrenophora seminiperda CCB06]